MPLLGLGVYKATEDNEAENAVISAVQNAIAWLILLLFTKTKKA